MVVQVIVASSIAFLVQEILSNGNPAKVCNIYLFVWWHNIAITKLSFPI